jgi:hypothetical protein
MMGYNAEGSRCARSAFVSIHLLSTNGAAEALYAVTTGVEVGRLGVAHTVTGVVFATTAPLSELAKHGTMGLVA